MHAMQVTQVVQGGALCDVAKRFGQSCALLKALNPGLAAERSSASEPAGPTTSTTTTGGTKLYVRAGEMLRAGPCSVRARLQQPRTARG